MFWLCRRKNPAGPRQFDGSVPERGLGGGRRRDSRKGRLEHEILTMDSRKGSRPEREGTFNSQVGATLIGDANGHRACGLERRLRAGEDHRLAGYARASFIVLQISESKSSLQEAPALTKRPPQEAR